MPTTLKILNWNTEIATPTSRRKQFEAIKRVIDGYESDVICLTEAHPETLPKHGQTIQSGLADWQVGESKGARKVLLWSRFGWHDIDVTGSHHLPQGRFVSATTFVNAIPVRFAGVCIPYHAYRTQAKWGDKRLKIWQGACTYLDELRHNILPQANYQKHSIILGDFNLQIPAHNYPYPNTDVNREREQTFEDWHIPTAGNIDDDALDKRFIDHVALSADMTIGKISFISRFGASNTPLSDHNGVYLEINL